LLSLLLLRGVAAPPICAEPCAERKASIRRSSQAGASSCEGAGVGASDCVKRVASAPSAEVHGMPLAHRTHKLKAAHMNRVGHGQLTWPASGCTAGVEPVLEPLRALKRAPPAPAPFAAAVAVLAGTGAMSRDMRACLLLPTAPLPPPATLLQRSKVSSGMASGL
jgi:hypothetical protein